ncbi:PREDICTED: uncharacterized protein LOC106550800 [Thamnophis sirtalis]|uniref:Uncharacterized protein LOC106550800 n=1 Tax=Thamnophis sirtalis TaxID=35019 RepID=A0A6I9YJ61_9SAUR|nr:PREDICTED: uncharacterized protein LOC106550800 [Thamnophis sirtalis]
MEEFWVVYLCMILFVLVLILMNRKPDDEKPSTSYSQFASSAGKPLEYTEEELEASMQKLTGLLFGKKEPHSDHSVHQRESSGKEHQEKAHHTAQQNILDEIGESLLASQISWVIEESLSVFVCLGALLFVDYNTILLSHFWLGRWDSKSNTTREVTGIGGKSDVCAIFPSFPDVWEFNCITNVGLCYGEAIASGNCIWLRKQNVFSIFTGVSHTFSLPQRVKIWVHLIHQM